MLHRGGKIQKFGNVAPLFCSSATYEENVMRMLTCLFALAVLTSNVHAQDTIQPLPRSPSMAPDNSQLLPGMQEHLLGDYCRRCGCCMPGVDGPEAWMVPDSTDRNRHNSVQQEILSVGILEYCRRCGCCIFFDDLNAVIVSPGPLTDE